jgi:hypothetical protein
MSIHSESLDALLGTNNKREPIDDLDDETGEDLEPRDKKTSITFKDLAKWGLGILAIFGAGYVLRGVADSANGTAGLLEAIRGPRDPGAPSVPFGMWGGPTMIGASIPGSAVGGAHPPTPEELAYWSVYYKRGAEAMQAFTDSLPKLPEITHEPLAPPSAEEKAAERAILSSPKPRAPRNPWGYGGGGGYGGSYDYAPPNYGGAEEFTIVKE